MVRFKSIFIILSLLVLTNSLLKAQRSGPAYYEDRQIIIRYVPPIGTMFLYGGKFFSQYYDEPTNHPIMEFRLYPYLYYGYESFGIYVQFMTRYLENDFYEIAGNSDNNDEENFGYDNSLIPNIISKGRIYLLNYFILQRNLQYYFGDILQTVRIGKLWIDYSPYTIYRTFGPEGIEWSGKIFPVNYDMFYSYNRVADTNYSTMSYQTNGRSMLGGKFNYENSDYISGEFIGLYYYADKFRNEKMDSIRIYKNGILDILNLEFLNVERYHIERDSGKVGFWKNFLSRYPDNSEAKYFYGRYTQYLMSMNLKNVFLTFIYRETTPDFMPYNAVTWMRYKPLESAIYDWIYETERAIKVNETGYQLNLNYNIAGVKFENVFEWTKYMDSSYIGPWLEANPPGFKFKFNVQYLIGWVTVSHKLTEKITSLERLQNFYTELYIPISGSLYIDPQMEYFKKKRSDGTVTDKIVQFLQIGYKVGNLDFKYEMKYSPINMDEPTWMTRNPYYIDQTWGIDNFIRFRVEYDF